MPFLGGEQVFFLLKKETLTKGKQKINQDNEGGFRASRKQQQETQKSRKTQKYQKMSFSVISPNFLCLFFVHKTLFDNLAQKACTPKTP